MEERVIFNNYSKYFTHYITKNFAHGLFSIFIPVYLYANGFSLFQVGLFYLIQEIVNFIFTSVLYQRVHRWGVRNITIIAVFAQIILVLITYNYLFPTYTFLLILAFFRGIHDSFYWGTYGIFIVYLSGERTGKFLGKWYFLTTLFQAAIIPFSGYVLDSYSPLWLVVSSVILYGISIIPLLTIKLHLLKNNNRIETSSLLKKRENRYIFVMSNLNEFLTKIGDSLIPLLIYFMFSKFFTIGVGAIFAILGGGIYSFVIGNISDKKESREKWLYFNIFSYLFSLVLIIFVKDYVLFAIIMILAFFKTGTVISSETGINKSCQSNGCYSKKILSRLGENIAGMLIGILIMIAGLISFSTILIICSSYIFLSFLIIKRYEEEI